MRTTRSQRPLDILVRNADFIFPVTDVGKRSLPGSLLASRKSVPGGGSHCGGRTACRLRCGARSGVAPRNSLRSLRSLRSDNRGENVYEVRCAHRPQPCAPRRHRDRPRRVPTSASEVIGSSGQHNFPVPMLASQWFWSADRHGLGVPGPAGEGIWFFVRRAEASSLPSCARAGCGAPLRRGGAQLSRLRAQRASSTFSSRLSERRKRSEQSEFRDAAVKARTAGQSTRSATAAVKRRRTPGRSFAASTTARNASSLAPVAKQRKPCQLT